MNNGGEISHQNKKKKIPCLINIEKNIHIGTYTPIYKICKLQPSMTEQKEKFTDSNPH